MTSQTIAGVVAPEDEPGLFALLARPPRLSTFGRYASVPAAVFLGFGIQYVLLPEPSIAPFVFFHACVSLSAWVGGRGPALLTVLALALVGNYFFVEPFDAWATSRAALTATVLFTVAGSAVALLSASFRSAALRAEQTAEDLRQHVALVHLSHDAVLVRQLAGPIESWSAGAEELYGYSSNEALRCNPEVLLHTVAPGAPGAVETTLRARGRWEGELTQTRKDGRVVTVAAKLQVVRGADGIERVLETHHDISDRLEAETALRAADRRKNEFLAMLSHELRNPLGPICNGLYLLDHVPPGSAQAVRAKAIVDRQVRQLTRLVDDLLDITRISRGKMQLQRHELDFGLIVRRTIDDYLSTFAAKSIAVTVRIAGTPLVVVGDETRLAQAIGNLLSNAAKFTKPNGHVTIALEEDASRRTAELRVRDDGIGIDRALLARLFTPFEQADRTFDGSQVGLGLGLGLALVKGLVEAHEGRVEARSEGPGKGSEFVIRLPLKEQARVAEPGTAEPLGRTGRRVLVIEDNVDAANSLREVLELGANEVAVANDGVSGLRAARSFAPEVVICDIGLPEMDGYEVAKAIRADEALRRTYLVALTGYALPSDVEKAKSAGFDEHLPKPPNVARLQQILSRPA